MGQLKQQTMLAEFGELARRSDDLDEILTEACRLVGHALGIELATVMELQGDGETLVVRAGVGWKPGVVGEVSLKATDGTAAGMVLKTGEPAISADIDAETRFKYPAFLTDNGVKAVATVSIIGAKDMPPFGLLQIDSRVPRQFDEGDTAFLRGYANLLAGAVGRLRAPGDVRGREARLRLALRAGGILGTWDLDLASGASMRSARHDEIFGYASPLLDWGLERLHDHVLPADRERVAEASELAVGMGAEVRFECRIRRAGDGAVRWIEVRGKPESARGGGSPTRYLGITADITDRKLAEEGLRESNKVLEASVAERTDELVEAAALLKAEAKERERVGDSLRQAQKMEAVGQLTGGLAHDFNNLLTGISGSLELMRIRADQGRTAEVSRYIDVATMAANRAASLIHRLLTFSRRQTLDPKPVDANALVEGMLELLRRTVGPSVELQATLASGIWPILCDPNQIENALLNLVINGRDAMADGGRLLIETANSVQDGQGGMRREGASSEVPAGEYVALSVTDTGCGMTAEVAARAFDPFFTTKPVGQGTGLGLSMIYGFVEQSGGHVRLRSEVGQGTTVTTYLPRHFGAMGGAGQADAAAELPRASASSTVVLVVEDEPEVRMIVLDVLSDLGYTVLEAADGRTGLQMLMAAGRVDLLVTDFGLPGGMNGRQLATAARQRRPELKVLLITGYAESAAGSGPLEHGMQTMAKPFAMRALAARVQGIIDG